MSKLNIGDLVSSTKNPNRVGKVIKIHESVGYTVTWYPDKEVPTSYTNIYPYPRKELSLLNSEETPVSDNNLSTKFKVGDRVQYVDSRYTDEGIVTKIKLSEEERVLYYVKFNKAVDSYYVNKLEVPRANIFVVGDKVWARSPYGSSESSGVIGFILPDNEYTVLYDNDKNDRQAGSWENVKVGRLRKRVE